MFNFEAITNKAIQFFFNLYKKDQGSQPVIENLFQSQLPKE